MTHSNADQSMRSLNSSRASQRSQSAVSYSSTIVWYWLQIFFSFFSLQIQTHRSNALSKHEEYLIQLQEQNRLREVFKNQHRPKGKELKQRETGFQLYLNGAHSAPKRRPPSILSKCIAHSSRTNHQLSFLFSFQTDRPIELEHYRLIILIFHFQQHRIYDKKRIHFQRMDVVDGQQ